MSKLAKALVLSLVLALMSVGGAVYAGWSRLNSYGDQALSENPKAPPVRLTIPKGSNARQVASILEQQGVIKSARKFYWYTRLVKKADTLLRPGEYDLSPGQNPASIVEKLKKGDVVTYKFTIPEGSSLKDIARIIGQSGLAAEAEVAKLCHDVEFARSLGVPDAQDHLEGYLFPDTYRFPSGTSAKDILKHLNSRTKAALTPDLIAKAAALNLNPHQLLTLASIVEKETAAVEERPQISAVFHNRLKKGNKLQTDPTVIYGIENYAGNITRKDLDNHHPYNTYYIPGLPPGPIAAPGAAAIKAAAEPMETDSFFFVSRNNGTHVFCATLACHEENVRKWQVEWFKNKKKADAPGQ